MGEVYRARDTKLDRDVALKILPEAFAADPERLARFEREAQTLAALNHPNIAHDLRRRRRRRRRRRALVMELVEGDDARGAHRARRRCRSTKRCRSRGRSPTRSRPRTSRASSIAISSPRTSRLRPDGTVKVLDFGLAKALEPERVGRQPIVATSPTITHAGDDRRGVILGTAAYMSPEQARGKRRRQARRHLGVRRRALRDAHRPRAFRGETCPTSLAAVLAREPDWIALPADVPPRGARLLRRCLEKDPRQRLRDIGEARIALAHPETRSHPADRHAQAPRRRFAGLLPWAVAASRLAAGGWAWTPKPATVAPLRKIEISLPTAAPGSTVVLSPDGRRIAYRVGDRVASTISNVHLTDLAASRASQRSVVFWSPDSAFVGYNDADAKLWIVPAEGGTPRQLCTIPDSGQALGANWHTDNAITFTVWRGSMYRVPSSGASPALVLKVDPKKEVDFHNPVVLPDGRVMIATHLPGRAPPGPVCLGVNRRQQPRPCTGRSRHSRCAPGIRTPVGGPGRCQRRLWALPYWAPSAKIEDGFLVSPGAAAQSAANDGSLLYSLASTAAHEHELVWVDRQGRS